MLKVCGIARPDEILVSDTEVDIIEGEIEYLCLVVLLLLRVGITQHGAINDQYAVPCIDRAVFKAHAKRIYMIGLELQAIVAVLCYHGDQCRRRRKRQLIVTEVKCDITSELSHVMEAVVAAISGHIVISAKHDIRVFIALASHHSALPKSRENIVLCRVAGVIEDTVRADKLSVNKDSEGIVFGIVLVGNYSVRS